MGLGWGLEAVAPMQNNREEMLSKQHFLHILRYRSEMSMRLPQPIRLNQT